MTFGIGTSELRQTNACAFGYGSNEKRYAVLRLPQVYHVSLAIQPPKFSWRRLLYEVLRVCNDSFYSARAFVMATTACLPSAFDPSLLKCTFAFF